MQIGEKTLQLCMLEENKNNFLPWKLGSKNILLPIFSPAIAIFLSSICCFQAHLHLLSPPWHGLSAFHKFKEPQIEIRP